MVTHTHPFNGRLSVTTRVSRHQKGKTSLGFIEARDSEWQWHQLSHMQVCTLLQTDNHASTPPLKCFTGRMPFLPPNQQHQSTEDKTSTMLNHFKIISATILCSNYVTNSLTQIPSNRNHVAAPPSEISEN